MVDVREEYSFDKGPLSDRELRFFEEMTRENIGELHEQDDLEYVRGLSEERRLIIRQLLAEVSRHRTDYTWEW